MSRKFLSLVAVGLVTSAFIACGDDDDDDANADDGSATTQSTSSTGGSGGTTGGTTRGTNGTGGNGGTGGATSNTDGMATTTGGSGGAGGAPGGGAGDGGMAGMAGATAMTDEKLLHVARTANLGEVEQAEIALMRADDPDVVEFAEMMVEDHSEAAADAVVLSEVEDLPPEPNEVSEMLEDESEQMIAMLESVSDAEFDLAYMNAQVMAHEEVLMLLSEAMIPHADNAALEIYLMTMSTHVSVHLETAETIVDTLE